MIPYWIMFGVAAVGSFSERATRRANYGAGAAPLLLAIALIGGLVGLRYRVGGDWNTYIGYLTRSNVLSFQDAVTSSDPGYMIVNWLVSQANGDVWLVNLICSVFFSWGLFSFARAQPRPWLAVVVAVPYLIVVVAMGYTRQGVAIGFAMLGMTALIRQGSILKFVLWTLVAATFHKTAVLLIPIVALTSDRGRVWTICWVGAATIVAYLTLLQSSVETLQSGYLDAGYQSNGAAIRVAMNAVPALILLRFRSRFQMAPQERKLWVVFSLLALASVVALVVSPSSTAVDRLGLYLIPLQLVVFSRVPYVFARNNGGVGQLATAVVLYSAAVQFIWLNFAVTAFAWLPYQLYPVF